MYEHNERIRTLAAKAIERTKAQLDAQFENEKLFGYALCTDDDVVGVYHAACTRTWVGERSPEYEDIGFISVEWEQSGDDSLFDETNKEITRDYEKNKDNFPTHRDMRFEALVLALKDCKDQGLFDEETHLSVGSTDPSDHLEFLEMRGIDRINKRETADMLAEALGFEDYRAMY